MTDYPKPAPELVQLWMEGCGGVNVFDIVYQIACKAAAWGYSRQRPKPESPMKESDQYEYIHISYRKDCPF